MDSNPAIGYPLALGTFLYPIGRFIRFVSTLYQNSLGRYFCPFTCTIVSILCSFSYL
jgi:hypothetical protein